MKNNCASSWLLTRNICICCDHVGSCEAELSRNPKCTLWLHWPR